MTSHTFNTRKKRVFDAVFGGVNISQPTPVATPATGFTAPGQIFGGLLSSSHECRQIQISDIRGPHQFNASDHVRDQVCWDRSWHTVTNALNVPDLLGIPPAVTPDRDTLDAAFYDALEDLLDPHNRVPFANQTESMLVTTPQSELLILTSRFSRYHRLAYPASPPTLPTGNPSNNSTQA